MPSILTKRDAKGLLRLIEAYQEAATILSIMKGGPRPSFMLKTAEHELTSSRIALYVFVDKLTEN